MAPYVCGNLGHVLLVLVAAGGGVVRDLSGASSSLAMTVVAPGLVAVAIIYFMGTVSGAHLNPAVSLAFAVPGVISHGAVQQCTVRGQYARGTVRGKKVLGYHREDDMSPHSGTETFAALELFVDNWRWQGSAVLSPHR